MVKYNILLLFFIALISSCGPTYIQAKDNDLAGLLGNFQNKSSKNDDGKEIFSVFKNDDVNRTFADVAALDQAKETLNIIVSYLRDSDAFCRLGAEPPSGVIFYGPPGTGKTEIARAIAGEVGKYRKVAFIVVSGSSFEYKYVGVGAKNVRRLFKKARSLRDEGHAVLIFIDEFDGVASSRKNKNNEQVIGALLTELDGFDQQKRKDIFIIAATNALDALDPAVIRPGRFDRKVEIGLPEEEDRRVMLEKFLSSPKPAIAGINIDWLIQMTNGWSPIELKKMVNEARTEATLKNAEKVEQEHFVKAIAVIEAGRPKP